MQIILKKLNFQVLVYIVDKTINLNYATSVFILKIWFLSSILRLLTNNKVLYNQLIIEKKNRFQEFQNEKLCQNLVTLKWWWCLRTDPSLIIAYLQMHSITLLWSCIISLKKLIENNDKILQKNNKKQVTNTELKMINVSQTILLWHEPVQEQINK